MPDETAASDTAPIGRSRREVLRRGLAGTGLLLACQPLWSGSGRAQGILSDIGDLGAPDKSGLRLPAGFSSRIIARAGQAPIPYGDYVWHGAPDGGATFPTEDGGWVYVSNSELDDGLGSVGAMRFDKHGRIVDAYSILSGTSRNCGGGPTPWGTWLSCEEVSRGQVWECDPLGRRDAVVRPALGTFTHEAAAFDPVRKRLYLTEDIHRGRLYRFTPNRTADDGKPVLASGVLEAAQIIEGDEGAVAWHRIADPLATTTPTRKQAKASTPFDGGEGIWYHRGVVYFVTKGDNRVWTYDVVRETIAIVYDDSFYDDPPISEVDNIIVSDNGEVLISEERGNMQIILLTADREVLPIAEIEGHRKSSVTGLAFDPSGARLYFSSQLGESGKLEDGVTFEIAGPFTS